MRRSKLLRSSEALQRSGSAGQWKRRAVETQGSFAAELRGKWQRSAVLLQECEDSGNAGQFLQKCEESGNAELWLRPPSPKRPSGNAGQWTCRAVATQGSGSAGQFCCRNARKVATQGSFAAEMRGQCKRRPVLLQKCGDSASAGQLCCRNARKVATHAPTAKLQSRKAAKE